MLDDFREWLSDNLRYILLGLAIILILIIGFCVVRLIAGSGSKKSSSEKTQNQTITENVAEADRQAETESGQQAQIGAEDDSSQDDGQVLTAGQGTSSLMKDDAAILALVKKYYQAVADKDTATLATICDPWNDEVRDSILQNNLCESYNNISTYSKKGPVDDSFVVYTYFLGKIANIETEVPSLTLLYLTTNEDGSLVVSDRRATQEVADYIAAVSSDDDVQKLIEDVNRQCEAAKDKDPALKEIMDSLDTGAGSGQEENTVSSEESETGEMVCMAQSLNIRQQPNTSSAVMGVLTQGTTVTKLQDVEGGWCQIRYVTDTITIEGYVMTQYLSPAGASGDTSGSAAAEDTQL